MRLALTTGPLFTAVLALLFGANVAACGEMPGASRAEASQSRDGVPRSWRSEWPRTDFSKRGIDLDEIADGGPPKDGIPSIDEPRFIPARAPYPIRLGENEPVISFEIDGDARAYPLRVLMRHEIVNDRVGGVPVAVTYCPLCDSSVVFDRRAAGRTLEFGTTGKLRYSDLVMYDRQTESWWQQFLGEAIVGDLAGTELAVIPSRVEAVSRFRSRFPEGRILLPPGGMPSLYSNPYVDYDSRSRPYPFFSGPLPGDIEPMARVVAVGDKAWSLRKLAREKRIVDGDLMLEWQAGQNSALDKRDISRGRDIGNVVVRRRSAGGFVDVPYDVTFAFAFHAFRPEGDIID